MAIFNSASGKAKPIFTPTACINRRQRKTRCNICFELCPENVFSMDPKAPISWDKCTNCGICVSACPSRSFAPEASLQKIYTHDLDLDRPVTFSCYKESTLCDKTVECLAGLPWELLAVVALYTDVVLYIGACSECGNEKRISQLKANLETLRVFLGDELFSKRVHLLNEGQFEASAEPEKLKSRRDIFSDLKQSVLKGAVKYASARLPFFDDEENTDGLQYRELLSKTVLRQRSLAKKRIEEAKENTPDNIPSLPTYAVSLPTFTTKCYGCGICEKICPHQALEIGKLEDGKRLIYITPWKCTACGLCMNACPNTGMKGYRAVDVPHLEKLALVKISSAECEMCKRAIEPNGPALCPSCALKAKKKLR